MIDLGVSKNGKGTGSWIPKLESSSFAIRLGVTFSTNLPKKSVLLMAIAASSNTLLRRIATINLLDFIILRANCVPLTMEADNIERNNDRPRPKMVVQLLVGGAPAVSIYIMCVRYKLCAYAALFNDDHFQETADTTIDTTAS